MTGSSSAQVLSAHRYGVQRLTRALVARDVNARPEPGLAVALTSMLIAALLLAGAAAYGLIRPGGEHSWASADTVIVERQTGARYVYLDGLLHPVANYASARLILGNSRVRTVTVAAGSLSGVPRGAALGIPGAPESIPARGKVSRGPWHVCAETVVDAGKSRPFMRVAVGEEAGGAVLDSGALLVRGSDGVTYLLLRGYRHRVRDASVVLPALGWGGATPRAVGAAFVQSVPAGADLARLSLSVSRGEQVDGVASVLTGQVVAVETQGGGRQHYLGLPKGLGRISQVQADLLLGDPDSAAAYPDGQVRAVSLSAAAVAQSPQVPAGAALGERESIAPTPEAASLPTHTPTLAAVAASDAVCAEFAEATAPRLFHRPGSGGIAAGGAATDRFADRVQVRPGHGAVVAERDGGVGWLLTDQGVRHSVGSNQIWAMLGLGGVTPVILPASVIATLPIGCPLDPTAARIPQQISTVDNSGACG